MEDSTEKSKKLNDETDLHSHYCPFCLPIFDSILQPLITILKFLANFNGDGAYPPTPSSPEDCYTAGSDPPSTAEPPHDESEEESEYYRHRVPPPPWSTGGGGQTD